MCLSTSTETMAARLFKVIGRDDLNADPRYATARSRLANVEEVDRIVSTFIKQKTLAQNLALFEEAEVTIGPICDAAQLVEDRYVIERESIVEVDDDDLGSVPMHNIVPRMNGTPGAFRVPAPRIGQHSRELLAPMLGEAEYERLRAQGAIVESPAA
jgi:formyl-CoA transferase